MYVYLPRYLYTGLRIGGNFDINWSQLIRIDGETTHYSATNLKLTNLYILYKSAVHPWLSC